MDVGAEYANYSSDMTRTIPVNGVFSERQKTVYNAVLNVKNEVTKLLRPGILWVIIHKEVGKIMTSALKLNYLINQIFKVRPNKNLLIKNTLVMVHLII